MSRGDLCRWIVAVSLLAGWLTHPVRAARLYGVESASGTSQNVFVVHRSDGHVDVIGDAGFSKLSGLSYDQSTGRLYASTGNQSNASRSLLIIDPESGAGTLVGDIDTPTTTFQAFSDVAVDAAGQIYGVTGQAQQLIRVDPETGDGTLIGSIVLTGGEPTDSVQGLAFDAAGDLYGSTKLGQLIWIDVEDPGQSSLVATLGEGFELNAITFDADGSLYGVSNTELYLLEVSGTELEATWIGDTGEALRGLAFVPVVGDLDDDCDVDVDDAALFVANVTGPGGSPADPRADLDRDGDCDFRDWQLFAEAFTAAGPGCP
jgi:hypothetical protein